MKGAGGVPAASTICYYLELSACKKHGWARLRVVGEVGSGHWACLQRLASLALVLERRGPRRVVPPIVAGSLLVHLAIFSCIQSNWLQKRPDITNKKPKVRVPTSFLQPVWTLLGNLWGRPHYTRWS